MKKIQDLIKALEKFKVIMLINEMVEKIPCCIKFLQETLKLEEEPSKEGFISLTKNRSVVQDFQVPKEEGDLGCFNVPITVGNVFVGEALCDLGANGNFVLLSTFNRIGGANITSLFYEFRSCRWLENRTCWHG